MCMRERERERERESCEHKKPMPLESKFFIGVKEKSNGSLNKKNVPNFLTMIDLYIIFQAQ